MIRFQRALFVVFSALIFAALAFTPSCSLSPTASSGATGTVNLLLTDAATDDWQEVSVVIKAIKLHNQSSGSWETVWEADPENPDSGKVNLVNLSGISELLGSAEIPEGTYDRLKLVIDTDPANITLIGDNEIPVDPSNIVVVDKSRRGEISVELNPALTVGAGDSDGILVDFDLAHPLSIFDLNGKVVVNLQLRHRRLPKNLRHIQFARSLGKMTSVDPGGASFVMTTIRGSELTFLVNEYTIYVNAEDGSAGDLSGLGAGLPDTPKAVMVASNMNSDGSLFARRVWYSSNMDDLPRFSPDGIVRRVGDDWLKILGKRTEEVSTYHHRCYWHGITVFVDERTTWTFQGDTETPMGTGTSILPYIRRGFRVEVVKYVEGTEYPKVAEIINVMSAHEEGVVTDVTDTMLGFGWCDYYGRTYPYSETEGRLFGWWFYGLPWTESQNITDFVETVNEAKAAHLWVFARAELFWEAGKWAVEKLILAPEKLRDPAKITTNFVATETGGTMGVSTYCWWDTVQPLEMTVVLDSSGDFQTVVGSFVWNENTRFLTFEVPVDPIEWPDLLTTSLDRVRVWVRPVKAEDGTFSWHAYTVIAYQRVLATN